MHTVSDGERRRVQLAMGLIKPWKVVLLDEITVDLDLLTRREFLDWLKEESEGREATVVYATHILDQLRGWPTHLVHMTMGKIKEWGEMSEFMGRAAEEGRGSENSSLGELVLKWLKEDLKARGPRDGGKGEGKTYENLEGRGGYGQESKTD
jgi:CCR4-NOT complex subunit CAF16